MIHMSLRASIINAVWNELEKENKEFFEPYNMKFKSSKDDIMSEEETTQMIQKMISESDSSSKDDVQDN